MLEYKSKIKAFVGANFKPAATKEEAHYSYTTQQLLTLLFDTFPKDCIDEFDLFDILTSLGFSSYLVEKKNDKKVKKLYTTWALKINQPK